MNPNDSTSPPAPPSPPSAATGANIIPPIPAPVAASFVPVARLTSDDLTWFNDLKNQFKAVGPPDTEPNPLKLKIRDAIRAVIKKPADQLDAQDLADLETWLIELLPLEDLRQKVNSLRDDLQDMMGDEAWEKIKPSLTNQVATATEVLLLPEARRLQQELHWRAAVQPGAQSARLMLMAKVLLIFVIVLVACMVMAYIHHPSLVMVLFLAGTTGAFVSCVQRIQSADLTSSRAVSVVQGDRLALGVVISPLLGGVFALVMALLLFSQTVTPGLVIPNVTLTEVTSFTNLTPETIPMDGLPGSNKVSTPLPGTGVLNPTNSLPLNAVSNGVSSRSSAGSKGQAEQGHPLEFGFLKMRLIFLTGKDLALFFLWSFAAGFFERLVPDMLTRLAKH